MATAFLANSNILDLLSLTNHITAAPINGATVTVTVKDSTGAEVSGQVWPATMSYVAASSGDYRAILSEDVAFVANKNYRAFVDADAGPGLVGHWEFPFQAKIRTGVTEDT